MRRHMQAKGARGSESARSVLQALRRLRRRLPQCLGSAGPLTLSQILRQRSARWLRARGLLRALAAILLPSNSLSALYTRASVAPSPRRPRALSNASGRLSEPATLFPTLPSSRAGRRPTLNAPPTGFQWAPRRRPRAARNERPRPPSGPR